MKDVLRWSWIWIAEENAKPPKDKKNSVAGYNVCISVDILVVYYGLFLKGISKCTILHFLTLNHSMPVKILEGSHYGILLGVFLSCLVLLWAIGNITPKRSKSTFLRFGGYPLAFHKKQQDLGCFEMALHVHKLPIFHNTALLKCLWRQQRFSRKCCTTIL